MPKSPQGWEPHAHETGDEIVHVDLVIHRGLLCSDHRHILAYPSITLVECENHPSSQIGVADVQWRFLRHCSWDIEVYLRSTGHETKRTEHDIWNPRVFRSLKHFLSTESRYTRMYFPMRWSIQIMGLGNAVLSGCLLARDDDMNTMGGGT